MLLSCSKPQRQLGVQMIRIKLPFGRVNPNQLRSIAEVAKKFSNGILHTTTRQDVQLHFVESNKVDELWDQLENEKIDGRETFGNTVRNITASSTAGVDIDEPFDVSPYAKAVDQYFRKAEINNDLGRKVKIAFSSNERDSAYTFMNDIGFLPTIENSAKGFKVFLGGGMAGQSMRAKFACDFLPLKDLIRFIEAVLRVFSQNGELLNRNKARLKFLIEKLGIDQFMERVNQEMSLIDSKEIDTIKEDQAIPKTTIYERDTTKTVSAGFEKWLSTNTVEQKQRGYYIANIRLSNGDISSEQVIHLADIVEKFASNDIRITTNQGIQLKFVHKKNLFGLYNNLQQVGLSLCGFNSAIDVTACPGTDTCNLGIANTTTLSKKIEALILSDFEELIYNHDLKIKVSGCMNACGHHTVASIGLQATTIKQGDKIYPGMHVLLGGGVLQDGSSFIAEKLLVVPSKKVPEALSVLLHDFQNNAYEGEYFNDYYRRQEKMYFFQLLLDVSKTTDEQDTIDWGNDAAFEVRRPTKAKESSTVADQLNVQIEEKQEVIMACLDSGLIEDALFHSYMVFVRTAKIKLLEDNVQCGTQMKILETFEELFKDALPKRLANYKDFTLSYKQLDSKSLKAKEYINIALDVQTIMSYDV